MQIVEAGRWTGLYKQVQDLLPDAFDSGGRINNLYDGAWKDGETAKEFRSPCDGSVLFELTPVSVASAHRAVEFAAGEHERWSRVALPERQRRVQECVDELRKQRELLAYLLVWEIGKPYKQALNSVDRCVSGVEWYVGNIDRMLADREPLGLISNIASWNYPLSVLMHAVLVQVLAGNPVIAKTPTDGGICTLTLAFGLARACGLPVSLVSGSGSELAAALVEDEAVSCLAFVGGKTNGRDIVATLEGRNKRYMLEMEGVNAWGIWDFSDWDLLSKQVKKGFEYGKQRCTAYPRYVIQRNLVPQFLSMYLPVLASLRVGHPLLSEGSSDEPPSLDFGPLINAKTVQEMQEMYQEALDKGAFSVYEGTLDGSNFVQGQDMSTYMAPAALVNIPHNCALYHREPFGPLDSIVIVDRLEEMVAEMNVSNGNLVASVATDDDALGRRVGNELRAFKVGINKVRSRGDREETFGGVGESWKGCFVGGEYLVQAVTQRKEPERLHGNFRDYTLLPDRSDGISA